MNSKLSKWQDWPSELPGKCCSGDLLLRLNNWTESDYIQFKQLFLGNQDIEYPFDIRNFAWWNIGERRMDYPLTLTYNIHYGKNLDFVGYIAANTYWNNGLELFRAIDKNFRCNGIGRAARIIFEDAMFKHAGEIQQIVSFSSHHNNASKSSARGDFRTEVAQEFFTEYVLTRTAWNKRCKSQINKGK